MVGGVSWDIFALMNDIKIIRWPGGQWNRGKKNFLEVS